MSDATPPAPPHPKHVAKGVGKFLTGRPAWQYIAGVTVLIGVAYMVYRRQQNAANLDNSVNAGNTTPAYQDPGVSAIPDSAAQSAGDYGGGYVTAAPTQGAFAGSSDPLPTIDGTADSGQLPTQAAPSITYNISAPTVAPGGYDTAPAVVTPPVTGGGPPNRPTVSAHTPPKPAAKVGALVAVNTINTNKAGNENQGKRYKTVTKTIGSGKSKHVHLFHEYESAYGKSDWGKGGSVDMGPA